MSEQQQDAAPSSALGFSIKGKARAKVTVNVAEKGDDRQLITAVAADGTIKTAEPASSLQQQYVVPALQNTYKAGVGKFVPSFVPESSTAAVTGHAEDRFERAAVGEAPKITSFGLEVRKRKDTAAANGSAAAAAAGGHQPLVPVQSRADDAAQLKADLENLPDEADVEEYEALPVEEFGKALLRGLGWSDGQGVGRKRQLVEPKQIVRRPERLGLGANPAAPPPDKRPRKMGDKPREDLVAAPTADGRVRHRVGLDEKLVPRSSLAPGPQPGKVMAVVAGRHAGLLAAVRELIRPQGETGPVERVLVELRPSGEMVEVAAAELDEREKAAAAAAAGPSSQQQRQQQERQQQRGDERPPSSSRGAGGSSKDREREQERERHRDRERDRDRDRGRDRERGRSTSSRQQQQQPLPPSKLWAAPLIRVRIVDKRVGGGRLYLKKGTVLDVRPDGACDIRLEEEGRRVVTVGQDQLETVVPKEAGAGVMVVTGRHKGRKGRLLQMSTSSGAAALQLLGDMEVVRLMLDDVAQFMGHLDEEDH